MHSTADLSAATEAVEGGTEEARVDSRINDTQSFMETLLVNGEKNIPREASGEKA